MKTGISHSKMLVCSRTIFTHTDRYNFVDPDYAYTDEEMEAVKSHKKHYVEYIKTMRENRIKNRKNE